MIQEFDIILSYKPPKKGWWPPWLPILRYFDKLLLKFNKKWYPNGNIKSNHVRIVIGPMPWRVLEATWPRSRIVFLEDWMLDPDYSKVYRPLDPIVNREGAIREAHKLQGKLYDVGQLLAMYFRWRRLDWGKLNMVCSVLVRSILEKATLKSYGNEPKLQETPPAFFANRSDILKEE